MNKKVLKKYIKIEKYNSPRVESYSKIDAKKYKANVREIENNRLGQIPHAISPSWVNISSSRQILEKRKKKNSKNLWSPKIYICVQAKNYVPFVKKLISVTKKYRLTWKFYREVRNRSRPDKIVVYFESTSELKRKLPMIRSVVKGCRFHSLSHSVNTSIFGIEKIGEGIYLGADPNFCKMSWRIYRIVVLSSIRANWKFWNQRRGGVPEVFKMFNLSLEHDGPNSLSLNYKRSMQIKKWLLQII